MTEDEAKTKACCGPEGCGYFNDNPYSARWCIGSACMAWRWATYEGPPPGAEPGKLYTSHTYVSETHGYCGFAGAPQ